LVREARARREERNTAANVPVVEVEEEVEDENESPLLTAVKRTTVLMEPSIPAPNPRNNGRNGGWKALQNHFPNAEMAMHEADEAFFAELEAAEGVW
jgi:hypothetical protein